MDGLYRIWNLKLIFFFFFSYDSQVALVRNSWSDLFILGMAQCSSTMNLSNILNTIVSHLQTSVQQEKLSAQRVRQVTTTICKVQEYVKAMTKMAIDEKEFALLKLIALFSAGMFFLLFFKLVQIGLNLSKVV